MHFKYKVVICDAFLPNCSISLSRRLHHWCPNFATAEKYNSGNNRTRAKMGLHRWLWPPTWFCIFQSAASLHKILIRFFMMYLLSLLSISRECCCWYWIYWSVNFLLSPSVLSSRWSGKKRDVKKRFCANIFLYLGVGGLELQQKINSGSRIATVGLKMENRTSNRIT